MGRFATHIAATLANADNLPQDEALPNISFWDVIMPSPRRKQKKEPVDPNLGMRTYDIKKDKNGKPILVSHKSKGDESGKKGEPATEDVKKGNPGGRGNKNNKTEGNQNQQQAKVIEGEEPQDHKIDWTPDQDAKIKAMKEEGKTWAQIAEEVGGTKGLVKNRFNQIKNEDCGDGKNNDGGKGAAKEGGGGGEKKDKGENKKENKKEKKQPKPDPPKAPSKAPSRVPSKAPSKPASRSGGNGEARFTMGEWRTLQEDDMFSFGELQCLSELAMRDEHQQWLRIASAFCDKTGRRVHPDDIRDKFAEIERMGSGR